MLDADATKDHERKIMKGFIFSEQTTIEGRREIIGFGDSGYCVKYVKRDLANSIIKKNHYSKKFFNLSLHHFGVFKDGALLGVLQFGYALNPASGGGIVEGTRNDEFLELNRMWLSDDLGKNSESKAISYCIKVIKATDKKIKFIQSFADERCGLFGVTYQAANFGYYGEHLSKFYEMDGVMYHQIIKTAKRGKGGSGYSLLKKNAERIVEKAFRQFRYLYFLKNDAKKKCLLSRQPYPKHSA